MPSIAYKRVIINTATYSFYFRPIQIVDLSEITREVVEGAPAYIAVLFNVSTIVDNLDISKFGEELEDKIEEKLLLEL